MQRAYSAIYLLKNLFPYNKINHNKILKSDWLSTTLISALIGQFNRTVRVIPKKLDSTRHQARA